jgi:DNA-binding response OmpR family regulator
MSARVLVVTADRALSGRLSDILARLGCLAEVLSSVPPSSAKARYELALADWDALRGGPARALRTLRRGAGAVVVVGDAEFVGGSGVSEALACGVSDVLLETSEAGALAGRLLPHLRSACVQGASALRLDDPARRVWRRHGRGWREIPPLPPKEFELLRFFLSHPQRVLSRAAILERFWREDSGDVNPETVDRHIQRLRHRLGAAGRLIVSVRGIGYRLDEDQHAPRSVSKCRARKRRKS